MLIGILTLVGGGSALAHDPGLSAAEVHIGPNRIVAEVSFSAVDLEGIQPTEAGALTIYGDGKRAGAAIFQPARAACEQRPFAVGVRDFQSGRVKNQHAFAGESATGTQAVLLGLRPGKSVAGGAHASARKLQELTVGLGQQSPNDSSIFRFLLLGVEHILTGYDHLAFLLALLLTGGSLRRNAKIITSFTVAHSLTLALATFGGPSDSAGDSRAGNCGFDCVRRVENLLGRQLAARWLVTFGFGLVSRSRVRRDVARVGHRPCSARARLFPLVSFNLGVEVAQIAIAALVLPLVWRLQQCPSFVLKHVPALSLLLTFAGVYWFLTRTLM
jgi:hypothetical protein